MFDWVLNTYTSEVDNESIKTTSFLLALFEIDNRFWVQENWSQNFARSTRDQLFFHQMIALQKL